MATYTQQLENVRKTIKSILETGQSVSYQGRSLTHANITELRKLEKEYEALAANENAAKPGRNRIVYVTPQV